MWYSRTAFLFLTRLVRLGKTPMDSSRKTSSSQTAHNFCDTELNLVSFRIQLWFTIYRYTEITRVFDRYLDRYQAKNAGLELMTINFDKRQTFRSR